MEVGALHQPLAIPAHAKVSYVDRMKTDELRREYPELAEWDLKNPIGTIETHLGKLKPGGVLFYAVPDKRFTFDFRREVTPLAEMVDDYDEGPERSPGLHIPALVVGPSARKATRLRGRYNHYSLLATIESRYHLSRINEAAGAVPMKGAILKPRK